MSLSTIIQHCLTGISLGGAYALIAIGYTMVYGILRLINFAHGDIFMMAGYFMIFAMASFPWYIAIPITLIGTVVLGVVIEKVAYKPLRSAPRMSIMISAIGVSYLLQNLATYLFTALPKGYPEIPILKKIYQFGDVSASLVTFITPVITIVLVIILIQLINHTKMGMAMRAVSKDYDTAQIMGIKINSIISYTFVIGSLLAGIGSILYFTDRMTVYPFSGSLPGLKCGCGSWRYRLNSRRRCRRIYTGHRRNNTYSRRIFDIQRRIYIPGSYYNAAFQTDRYIRRKSNRQGVRWRL